MTTERLPRPSTPLWINYRFVHVRDWNTSSLLEILFCLLWPKPWLVQSEQEPQIHQYLLMKSLPFMNRNRNRNRNLIGRRLLIARNSGGFSAVTIWEAYRPTAVTRHSHARHQELHGARLWVVQTLLKDLGPAQRTLVKNHDVMTCVLDSSALRGASWSVGEGCSDARVGETYPGPWCYTNSTSRLLGHPGMPFNLSSHYFYPLHKMGLHFFLLNPQWSHGDLLLVWPDVSPDKPWRLFWQWRFTVVFEAPSTVLGMS